MNELALKKRDLEEIPNRLAKEVRGFGHEIVVQPKEPQENPDLIEMFGVKEYMFDPQVKNMIFGLDEHVRKNVEEEKSHGGYLTYMTMLERMLQRYPVPFEAAVNAKQGIKVLEFLFQEIALRNKLSTNTYLKKVEKRAKEHRVKYLLSQLREALA